MDDDKIFKYSDMQFKAHYYGLVHTLCIHYPLYEDIYFIYAQKNDPRFKAVCMKL